MSCGLALNSERRSRSHTLPDSPGKTAGTPDGSTHTSKCGTSCFANCPVGPEARARARRVGRRQERSAGANSRLAHSRSTQRRAAPSRHRFATTMNPATNSASRAMAISTMTRRAARRLADRRRAAVPRSRRRARARATAGSGGPRPPPWDGVGAAELPRSSCRSARGHSSLTSPRSRRIRCRPADRMSLRLLVAVPGACGSIGSWRRFRYNRVPALFGRYRVSSQYASKRISCCAGRS